MALALTHPSSDRPALRASANVLYGAAVLLALALPFEAIRPLVSLGWAECTNLELLVGLTAVLWAGRTALLLLDTRGAALELRPLLSLPLVPPALLFLLVALISALLAPAHRPEALKFTFRLATGLYALLLTVHVSTSLPRLSGLLWALAFGAGGSALLGVGEAAGLPLLESSLALFKAAPTHVGGALRVSGSFQYATIAAMFFEMSAPLALALAATARSRRWQAIGVAICLLCAAVVVLTLTRSGLIALAAVSGSLLGLAYVRPRWTALAAPAVLLALGVVASVGALSLTSAAFSTRLATQNDQGWYGAAYTAPPTLVLPVGEEAAAVVTARNTGQVTWTATGNNAFALGFHWLSEDGQWKVLPGQSEVPLPHDVAPGEAIRLVVALRSPLSPGSYQVAWGMFQRDIVWFSQRGVPDGKTAVNVVAGRQAAPAVVAPRPVSVQVDRPPIPLVMPRAELWQAAWAMFLERPLLGVGPDNFRHFYGPYLGLERWDDRTHANNLYLELLVDVGLVGTLAFGWLSLAAVRVLVTALRAPEGAAPLLAAGMAASLLAFAVHGLFDYFLEFTSIYLLFWITLGLAAAAARLRTGQRL